MLTPAQHQQCAQDLYTAEMTQAVIPQLTKTYPQMVLDDAYAIQRLWAKRPGLLLSAYVVTAAAFAGSKRCPHACRCRPLDLQTMGFAIQAVALPCSARSVSSAASSASRSAGSGDSNSSAVSSAG